MAEKLGIPIKKVRMVLKAARQPLSLEAPVGDEAYPNRRFQRLRPAPFRTKRASSSDPGANPSPSRRRWPYRLANDPEAIARQLEAWRDEKRKAGHIAPLRETVRAEFSRDEQFGRLEVFLQTAVSFSEGPGKGDDG